MNTDAAFFAFRSAVFEEEQITSHLTSEEVSDFVDKNFSGETLQVISDHLSQCEQCNVAVDDLRVFRNEIAPSIERQYLPTGHHSPVPSWWQRTFGDLYIVVSPGHAVAAVMAILLVAVAGWLFLHARQGREPKEEIAVSSTPSPQPQSSVEPGQPEPAAVVAQLKDGERVLTLDKEGKLSGADDLPVAYQNLMKKALTTQRIERSSQLDGLSRSPSSLMSSDKESREFAVNEPVGNVVMTSKPTFRWSPMKGATSYVVEVYDSQFKLLARSEPVTGNSWQMVTSLSRGSVYSWQVKAINDGQETISPRPPAPQAKFRVLDQVKSNELMVAKRAYANSHLALGLLYAQAGLLKESEQELRLLLKENPNSELARKLLNQVEALQRKTE
jgi:hypothetical protein